MSALSAGRYKEYLKKVLDLELELYQLKRLRANIKNQHNRIQKLVTNSKPAARPTSDTTIGDILSGVFSGLIAGAMIGFALWLFRLIFFLIDKYSLLFFIGVLFTSFSEIHEAAGRLSTHVILIGLVGAIIGFIVAFLPVVNFRIHKKGLEEAYDIEESNRKKLVTAQKKDLDVTSQMYQKCETSIRQTEQILNQYYSLDIIYKKYRGLVPVATMYEYFDAGLCTELTGHEGAYLIYERQLQANIIIGKLDQIIDRLDEIIANQRILAEGIQTSNRMIDGMSRSVKSMIQNQAVNNYYSQISASNSQFLAEYTVYKEILR